MNRRLFLAVCWVLVVLFLVQCIRVVWFTWESLT